MSEEDCFHFISAVLHNLKIRYRFNNQEALVRLRKTFLIPGKTRNQSLLILDKYVETRL